MPTFEISRSAVIDADPARVWDLVADLRQWPTWSPWDDADADTEREFGGPDQGAGATCHWDGGRRAGRGSMAVTAADPERIDLVVAFEKPFRATNDVTFVLRPTDRGATEVTWTMRGERRGLMGVVARVVPVDSMLGRDFERGLAQLADTARA